MEASIDPSESGSGSGSVGCGEGKNVFIVTDCGVVGKDKGPEGEKRPTWCFLAKIEILTPP